MDWNKRLDELRERLELGSDAKLAAYLGVSRSFLSQIRLGKSQMPMTLAVKIMDRIGFVYTSESVLSLLPSDIQEVLVKKIQEQAARIANKNGDQ